ncbi:ABC transporter permease [Wenzhouxiangella sp. AB-CW3]|uniref:ABC transporter permease/M1 family aminopeptidase n=1 Tax=Wenzhouxiangella sp. AB-CW3 TaxID=2771012 RepID=UPI00168B07B5|nr:M1 family aminopeptidase [Wenzhouxiangella sp. AB-CW3]QOC23234.1 ABC transporter permease [Wenzhouxiangella sp. AB-CW3]
MFIKLARTEWRYLRRQPSFFVTLLVFFLLTFLATVVDQVQIGGPGPNVLINGPWNIAMTQLILSLFAMFLVANFIGNTATRDWSSQMEGIVFSTPLKPAAYLWGRFAGSWAVVMLVFATVPLAIWFGSLMPWVDSERFGPTVLSYYLWPYVYLVMPSLLFCAALFYALAIATRSMMAMYLGVVGFFILYLSSQGLLSDPQYRDVAALLDPFGIGAFASVTRYWTTIELNTMMPAMEGVLLHNRLLWLGVTAVLIGLTHWLIDLRRPRKSRGKPARRETAPTIDPLNARIRPNPNPGMSTSLWQLWLRSRFEMSQIVRSWPFIILLLLTVFQFSNLLMYDPNSWYGTNPWPITRYMVDYIGWSFDLIMLIIIAYYTAEVVWRERQSGMGDIVDSLPTPDWVLFVSKLMGLYLVIFALLALGVVLASLYQASQGFFEFEMAQYLVRISAYTALPFMLIAVLAVLLQVVSPNKFVGIGLFVLFIITTLIFHGIGLEHSAFNFGSSPMATYSDINQYGPFAQTQFWYMLYWAALTLVLAVLSHGLWQRGPESALRYRLRHLPSRLGPYSKGLAGTGLLVFAASGAWIAYNTAMLNESVTSRAQLDLQADYEQTYRPHEELPVPAIASVFLEVDIEPETRRLSASGHYQLKNRGDEPIDRFLLMLPPHVSRASAVSLEVEQGRESDRDETHGAVWVEFDSPMAPGEQRRLEFNVDRINQGFADRGRDLRVVRNGTFINNFELLPMPGYQSSMEISDRHERRKRDLPPPRRMNDLDDDRHHAGNYLTPHTDFIDFEAIISTHPDQVALAPGYIEREWTENGRRYFHYKMDAPILSFFNIMSADLALTEDEHDGVAIKIYHHPDHAFNVERMIESVRDSLDYFSREFSPYQHRQVRIIEFPGYSRFAQAFPNTIPYSEDIGFIADLRDPDDIDYVYYVTAHEVAHQWWAHQVVGANVQGAEVLSESLSQYSALMVLEENYGPAHLRRFLKYELDNYLRGRAGEALEEQPLKRSESQPYIHYQKGSLVMYALRDRMGEEAVNRALRQLIDDYAFRSDLYPTTRDLIAALRAEADEDAQQLITDLFERIVLFELRTESGEVEEREDGRFDVTLTIQARKLEADGQGEETEQPLDEWFDIGLFTAHPDDIESDSDVLYFQRHRLTDGENIIRITVDEHPSHAGVDPYVKMINRFSDENVTRL